MDESKTLDRRKLLKGCLALGAGALSATPLIVSKGHGVDRRPVISRVAILKVNDYSDRLDQILMNGLSVFKLDLQGKSVLLKPNLVEYYPGKVINTDPRLIGAAAECFLRLGAQQVRVGEGAGHQRDTERLISETGLEAELRQREIEFIDLNRDDLIRTRLKSNFTGSDHLWLPKTVLETDFLVSMPKVKTHHWAGVTLSMKNMFGIVPGLKYGWPKNLLHWQGIHESILDICSTVPIHFVIADGIVAMEGNGPLHGESRELGIVLLADDPVAADATACRLMGLIPQKIQHLHKAGEFLGNLTPVKIQQVAEPLSRPHQNFRVLPAFSSLLEDRY